MSSRSRRSRVGAARVCLAVLLILAVSGAGSTAASNLVVTEKDAGSTVKLSPGDRLEVVLAGNPTTGYNWRTASVDAAVLREAGPPSFQRDSDLVGSGGAVTLSFTAEAPGRTILTIVYDRTFEKNIPPLKTYELTVVVQPSQ